MTVVMVTEYSRVLPWQWLYEAWLASHWFVEQMRRGDWLAIVAYDMKPQILVDFTQNNMEAFNALRALNFPAFRESNLYDAIFDVLERLKDVEGKTAIVLISTGLDTFSRKNFGEILDAVKETNVVIYAVSLGGYFRTRYDQNVNTNARMDLLQADSALKAFTKYTGGQAFFPRFLSQYAGHFQAISKLLRHQYSLGYISTNTAKDGKFRKIKVKVTVDIDDNGKPDKLKVKHREGYPVEKSSG
jgi:VWFA-related protein